MARYEDTPAKRLQPRTKDYSTQLISNKLKPFLIECKFSACIFVHIAIELLMKEDSGVIFEGAQLLYYL